jgi:hypothetical protein
VAQRQRQADEDDESTAHDQGQHGRLQPQQRAADQGDDDAQGRGQVPGRHTWRSLVAARRLGLTSGLSLGLNRRRSLIVNEIR